MSEQTLTLSSYKCRVLVSRGSGVPVIFLHGYSFTCDVWQRTSVTELLKAKNVPFTALDMPYGAKSKCQPRTRDIDANVAVVKEAVRIIFGQAEPVVVGASLGGYIALNYAARFPVKGLLLLAPARVLNEETVRQAQGGFKFPLRIIVGSEDRIASVEELRDFAGRLPNAKLVVYEHKGHAAYLGRPDRFKRDLLELYAMVA